MLLDENNVQDLLVRGSQTRAVFTYFFVDAPECAEATQAVRRALPADSQYVALAEADVSTEVGQAIALQLGLRSVPALIVLRDSQPVDALRGDEIAGKIDALVQKYLPSRADTLESEALEAEAAGDLAAALSKAREAYDADQSRLEFKFTLARLYIKAKNLPQARALLDSAGREEQSRQEYKDLLSALTLAEQAADSPEIRELQKAYEAHPEDNALAQKLAAALAEGGRHEEALNLLFAILKRDVGNAEIRKTFLDITASLSGSPLQKTFRRKLYTLMY